MLKRQGLRIERKQKEAKKAERRRKVAQAAVRAQAALECTQEAEEAVGGIRVVEELKMRVFGLQKSRWKVSSAIQAYRHLHSLLVEV
jgi:hypothetical protein